MIISIGEDVDDVVSVFLKAEIRDVSIVRATLLQTTNRFFVAEVAEGKMSET